MSLRIDVYEIISLLLLDKCFIIAFYMIQNNFKLKVFAFTCSSLSLPAITVFILYNECQIKGFQLFIIK